MRLDRYCKEYEGTLFVNDSLKRAVDDIYKIPFKEFDRETINRQLNRLMFIYFIQKKGLLDGDINYLKNKLNFIKELRGVDKFYKSFYKLFLCRLFHEGL